MITAYASPHFTGRQLNNIRQIVPRVAYNGYVLLKNLLATFKSHVYEDFHVISQLLERAIWLIELNSLPKKSTVIFM